MVFNEKEARRLGEGLRNCVIASRALGESLGTVGDVNGQITAFLPMNKDESHYDFDGRKIYIAVDIRPSSITVNVWDEEIDKSHVSYIGKPYDFTVTDIHNMVSEAVEAFG
jgi:hypothetical protein